MKIVNILGGLGNQMFQYAFATALQAKYPEEVVRIDLSGFRGYPLHNGFELARIFDIGIKEATFKEQITVYILLEIIKCGKSLIGFFLVWGTRYMSRMT